MGQLTLPNGERLMAQAQVPTVRSYANVALAMEVVTNFGVRFVLELGGRSFGKVQPSMSAMVLLMTPCCGSQYWAEGWDETSCHGCDVKYPLGIHYTEVRYLSLYPVERMFEAQAALVVDPVVAHMAAEALGVYLEDHKEILSAVHSGSGTLALELP